MFCVLRSAFTATARNVLDRAVLPVDFLGVAVSGSLPAGFRGCATVRRGDELEGVAPAELRDHRSGSLARRSVSCRATRTACPVSGARAAASQVRHGFRLPAGFG